MARLESRVLVVGVDANAENLRDSSRRAARKPARGGAPNALFARLALEEAPGELAGLADELTVHLPWGSLLRAVALPELEGLGRLAGVCKPGARVRFVFGYQAATDGLDLPPLDGPAAARALEAGYRAAGLVVAARPIGVDRVRLLPSTWARKLAAPGARPRPFVEVTGHAAPLAPPPPARHEEPATG